MIKMNKEEKFNQVKQVEEAISRGIDHLFRRDMELELRHRSAILNAARREKKDLGKDKTEKELFKEARCATRGFIQW